MVSIHLVSAAGGGVGKSLLSLLLFSYFAQKCLPDDRLLLFDDSPNPTLASEWLAFFYGRLQESNSKLVVDRSTSPSRIRVQPVLDTAILSPSDTHGGFLKHVSMYDDRLCIGWRHTRPDLSGEKTNILDILGILRQGQSLGSFPTGLAKTIIVDTSLAPDDIPAGFKTHYKFEDTNLFLWIVWPPNTVETNMRRYQPDYVGKAKQTSTWLRTIFTNIYEMHVFNPALRKTSETKSKTNPIGLTLKSSLDMINPFKTNPDVSAIKNYEPIASYDRYGTMAIHPDDAEKFISIEKFAAVINQFPFVLPSVHDASGKEIHEVLGDYLCNRLVTQAPIEGSMEKTTFRYLNVVPIPIYEADLDLKENSHLHEQLYSQASRLQTNFPAKGLAQTQMIQRLYSHICTTLNGLATFPGL